MKSPSAWICSFLPVFIAAFVLLGLSLLFSGCYTLKQGAAMLGYLNRAIPLEDLAAENGGQEDDRLFALRVEDIRRFATEELGLRESENYTRYVSIDRDYLAAVVSACAKDSFTRYEWWFPVVGSVPYKGFFNAEDAMREREKLEKKDLDVWIREVDAFSTLGWFRDPLYSYMKNYSVKRLADLIIHELLHATVYIKSHSQFNEELAEFVGSEGARLYMEKNSVSGSVSESSGGDSAEEALSVNVERDSLTYRTFIRSLIEELDAMYNSDISREEKLRRKEEIIAAHKARFEEEYDSLFITDNYRGFIDLPVNNAYLELFRLYYGGDNYFESLYERSGGDLRKFIMAARTINTSLGREENPRDEFEAALGLR